VAVDPLQQEGQGWGLAAIHGEDHIAFPQSGFRRPAILGQSGDHDALHTGQSGFLGQCFIHGADGHAEEGALDPAEFDQVPGHLCGQVGGHGKRVARITAGSRRDGGVDAHELSTGVDEGAP